MPYLVVRWEVLDPRASTIDPLGNFIAGEVPGVYEGAIRVRLIQRQPWGLLGDQRF